jgi:hypothetical protein
MSAMDDFMQRLVRAEDERDRLREALRKVRGLAPLYIRPSGGKDYHSCHFIARAALATRREPS